MNTVTSDDVTVLRDMLARVHLDINEAQRLGKPYLELLKKQAAALTKTIAAIDPDADRS